MSEKSKSFDILGDILNDSPTGLIRGMDELNKLIYAGVQAPLAKAQPSPPGQQVKRPLRRRPKHKTTHYLTAEVFANLGEAKAGIRDFLPMAAKHKATKSGIIESAIKVVLQELEAKGKDSALIQELLNRKEE